MAQRSWVGPAYVAPKRVCNTCEYCDPESLYITNPGQLPSHFLSVCDENGHLYGAVIRCPHYQQASEEKLKALEDAVCKLISQRRGPRGTAKWPKPKQ